MLGTGTVYLCFQFGSSFHASCWSRISFFFSDQNPDPLTAHYGSTGERQQCPAQGVYDFGYYYKVATRRAPEPTPLSLSLMRSCWGSAEVLGVLAAFALAFTLRELRRFREGGKKPLYQVRQKEDWGLERRVENWSEKECISRFASVLDC